MKSLTSKFIEVEFRVPKNLSEKIKENYGMSNSCIIECKDVYFEYCAETGNLHRFRKMMKNGVSYFCESSKAALAGYFLETKRKISSEEYKRALYMHESRIVGVVEGSRIKIPYDGIVFCLDDVRHLGEFTEFEIKVNNECEIQDAELKLKKIAEELGVSVNELSKKTYPALLIETGIWKLN